MQTIKRIKTLIQKKQLDQAHRLCMGILESKPDSVETLKILIEIYETRQQYKDALPFLDKLITLQPEDPEFRFRKAFLLEQLGQLQQALDAYAVLLRTWPDHFEALVNSGNILRQSGAAGKSLPFYQKAISIKPEAFEGYFNLGLALMDLSHLKAAVKALLLCLQKSPGLKQAHLLIGFAYRKLNEFDKSREHFRKILQNNPADPDALLGLAYIDHENLQFQPALDTYNQVLESDPDNIDAHWNRSTLLLLRGNFTEGWEEFEWRKKLKRYPKYTYPQPQWDGSDLKGKRILLEAEQGFGDSIQFIRFGRNLKEMGANVYSVAAKPLHRLFQHADYLDQVLLPDEVRPEFDCYTSLMSLPQRLNIEVTSIPAEVPYFKLGTLSETKKNIFDPPSKLKVGISWAGNPLNSNDLKRSCPLHYFESLLDIPGISLFSLQFGAQKEALMESPISGHIVDLTAHINDFYDTALLMNELDLILSVDSAPAHLAGAIGKSVWMLIPHFPDWRWLLDREDSPWYPTMRIFRQPDPGNWKTVFENIKNEMIRM